MCAPFLCGRSHSEKLLVACLDPESDDIGGVHGVHGPQEMKRVLDPIAREVGMAQSIVDTWMEEWLQQGVQQGIQQGVQQEKEQGVQRLLRRGGFSHEEIASLMNVEVARVQKIAESVAKGS